jgi:hypothetical protein
MPVSPLFHIRPVSAGDVSFIYNSWLKSYRDSPQVKSIPNTLYYAEHHAVIENIFKSPNCTIGIACNPEEQDQIYGYLVGDILDRITKVQASGYVAVVHWLYVKHPFRMNGIAKGLFNWFTLDHKDLTFVYTHRVKNVEKLIGERPFVFNPYLLSNRVAPAA